MTHRKQNERRSFYRLTYLRADRPILTIDGEDYEVTELSEGGLRFLVKGNLDFGDENWFRGSIRFHDGEQEPVGGVVIREEDSQAVVLLQGRISFQRMMKEQRYIRARYRK